MPETYTTYAIRDPRSGKFVYVGQTINFYKRRKNYLKLRSKRPKFGLMNIKLWMYDALSSGIRPDFVILEKTEDEETSLRSEMAWAHRLRREGHPLLNRWRDHKAEPDPNRKNILQLWKENEEKLPFIVANNGWSMAAGHYVVVEKVEIRKWPYGLAWGRYHWRGRPSRYQEAISKAGSCHWKPVDSSEVRIRAMASLTLSEIRSKGFTHIEGSCETCRVTRVAPIDVVERLAKD